MTRRVVADASRLRESGSRALLIGFPLLLAAALAGAVPWAGDYGAGNFTGDDPAVAISALLHGHLMAAAHDQPFIGLTSIILRLPVVALARLFGSGTMLEYRLGVFVCGWATGLVGVVVARWARARGRSLSSALLIVTLMVLSPMAVGLQLDGHPEELLGGALCVAAVLSAMADRPMVAGVMLGLALGTKEWALVAVVPVVLACSRQRLRMVTVAAGVAAPLVLVLPLLDPSAFLRVSKTIGDTRFVYFRSWWWPLVTQSSGTPYLHLLPFGLSRTDVSWLDPAAALALGWRYQRMAAHRDSADALGLLALLLLLRCTLDPEFSGYYVVPFLIALLAWEALVRKGLPLGALLAMSGFFLGEHLTSRTPAFLWDFVLTLGLTTYLVHGTLLGSARSAPLDVLRRTVTRLQQALG